MSDLHPCKTIVLTIGQELVNLALPGRCATPPFATYLIVRRPGKDPFAKYAMHGVDAMGILFYVDRDLTGTAGNYQFEVEWCGSTVCSGNLIVGANRVPLIPTNPGTACPCPGC